MGLSSRTGIVPLALSQDVGGPLGRSVTDVAIVLDATAGVDPADPATSRSAGHIPQTYTATLDRDGLRGARIGVLLPLFGDTADDQRVGSVARSAVRQMAERGAIPIDVSLPVPAEGDASLIRLEFKFNLNDYLA